MSDGPVTIGWQILDPDGNVVESGDAVMLTVDMAEEIAQRLADDNDHNEGAPWPG